VIFGGDEASLPKWAQHKLDKLRADNEYQRKQLVAVRTGDTDVWIWHGGSGVDTPLPPGTIIEFKVGTEYDQYFHVSLTEQNNLYVSCGFSEMLIKPVAGNAIEVRIGGN
jgi:hypothetical protein